MNKKRFLEFDYPNNNRLKLILVTRKQFCSPIINDAVTAIKMDFNNTSHVVIFIKGKDNEHC